MKQIRCLCNLAKNTATYAHTHAHIHTNYINMYTYTTYIIIYLHTNFVHKAFLSHEIDVLSTSTLRQQPLLRGGGIKSSQLVLPSGN